MMLLARGAFLFLVVAVASTTAAQDCPFPDSAAVADTLDPAGYFPLSVGSSWDYVVDLHDFPAPQFRRTVEKDTVIGDLTFAKIKHVDFIAVIVGGVVAVDSSYSYEAVVDGKLKEWDPAADSAMTLVDLGSDFNTCVSVEGWLHVVTGGYDRQATLWADTLSLAAKKQFQFRRLLSLTYGYGVGLLRDLPVPGGSSIDLAGFTIDGESRGATLDSIFSMVIGAASNDIPGSSLGKLVVFPNPLRVSGWVQVDVEAPGQVRIEATDILGRRFHEVAATSFLTPGRHVLPVSTRSMTPGLYLVRLLVNGQVTASGTVVVVK